MEWDSDGDTLCAVCDKGSTMFMWDANQKKVLKIDSGAKDVVTFLSWSVVDLQLALGKNLQTCFMVNVFLVKKTNRYSNRQCTS